MLKSVLVTGSSGLVGSEVVLHYDRLGIPTLGIDNNLRRDFFGEDGDTTWNLENLKRSTKHFQPFSMDIRNRDQVRDFIETHRPDAIIHSAAQPSHDLAAARPFDDFDVNAVGTLNLLEAARRAVPNSPFVLVSTNKVYGDRPNQLPLVEHASRYDYAEKGTYHGIDESMSVDRCLHSLFGVSKLAADVMTQEYGRYFNMPTACFRCGCITGGRHSGAKLHGFLQYFAKVASRNEEYSVIGYQGKQVRDQIHAADLVAAFDCFVRSPNVGAVYNMGGGRERSISILELLKEGEKRLGQPVRHSFQKDARVGDHICYISDIRAFQSDYPSWKMQYSLEQILDDVFESESHQNSRLK